ncbi:MAG: glycosyltransferase family 2 protein [Bifidobacteriaceae bacterium]|nr:glycosyltransferase family 2 protein [Bifidobacteriaceae bacterium]
MEQVRSVRQAVDRAVTGARVASGGVVNGEVTAIVTVESDLRFLRQTLAAVLSQTVIPGTIIVADCSDRSSTVDSRVVDVTSSGLHFAPPSASRRASSSAAKSDGRQSCHIYIAAVSGASSFTDAVGKALDRVSLPLGSHLMWLLHDDSRPADEHCLEELLRVRRNTPTVSVIGAKQLDWDGERLHNVGYLAGPHHKVMSLVVDGEPDQEQYDDRSDVYVVSLTGALVFDSEWERLSGGEPHVGTFADSRDFCRRVCRSGGRVVVAPKAAIAHRRARFEGVRTASGAAAPDGMPVNTFSRLRRARDIYLYSDISRSRWLLVWLWRLLYSLYRFFSLVVRKHPFAAGCELLAPWSNLVSLHSFAAVRRNVKSQTMVSAKDLAPLVASNERIGSWRKRRVAFLSEDSTTPTDPLTEGYLREQARIKHAWAFWMTLAALLAGLAVNWPVLRGAFNGGQIVSDSLLPSGASMKQLAGAATSSWSYAAGLGVNGAPTPFLLFLIVCTAVCAGHVSVAVIGIMLLAAPLSALSFWALGGIMTRSNPVRVLTAFVWMAFGMVAGLYSTANLPMLVVSVFLPAGIAFVCKAVGMYRTEERTNPTPSAQSAAWASLCLACVVAAEPQYALALCIAFVLFLALVRSHRLVLLMVPVPAAVVAAPVLVRSIRDIGSGQWRQLFGDIMVPTATVGTGTGVAGGSSFFDVMLTTLGFSDTNSSMMRMAVCCAAAALAMLTVLAFVALCKPSALRISRLMWTLIMCGVGLMFVSNAVVVAIEGDTAVHGSVLPGLFLAVLGLLACACIMAGVAASPFAKFVDSFAETGGSGGTVGRIVLSAMLIVTLVAWGAVGVFLSMDSSARASTAQLPMVTTEYLDQSPSHRVLAVRVNSGTDVSFSVMRTSRGDLVDSSPSVRATQVQSGMDPTDQRISSDLVALLLSADSESSFDLESMGFGGVYVVNSEEPDATTFVSNLLASQNTQSVVDKDGSSYIRFTGMATDDHSIDTSAQNAAMNSVRRKAWLVCLVAVMVVYCLVAIPFSRSSVRGGVFDE